MTLLHRGSGIYPFSYRRHCAGVQPIRHAARLTVRRLARRCKPMSIPNGVSLFGIGRLRGHPFPVFYPTCRYIVPRIRRASRGIPLASASAMGSYRAGITFAARLAASRYSASIRRSAASRALMCMRHFRQHPRLATNAPQRAHLLSFAFVFIVAPSLTWPRVIAHIPLIGSLPIVIASVSCCFPSIARGEGKRRDPGRTVASEVFARVCQGYPGSTSRWL
jgi:hypothetical protein